MGIDGSIRSALAAGFAVAMFTVVLTACSSANDPAAPTTIPAGPGSTAAGGTAPVSSPGTAPAGALAITSTAFADGGSIPLRYACTNQGGEAASPPLAWTGVPAGAATLVLVVHDPDAPREGGFTHLVTSFPPDTTSVADGANQAGDGPMANWIGPCPPSGEHHYVFTLLAFGAGTAVPEPLDKAAVDALAPDALATAELTGLFAHQG